MARETSETVGIGGELNQEWGTFRSGSQLWLLAMTDSALEGDLYHVRAGHDPTGSKARSIWSLPAIYIGQRSPELERWALSLPLLAPLPADRARPVLFALGQWIRDVSEPWAPRGELVDSEHTARRFIARYAGTTTKLFCLWR